MLKMRKKAPRTGSQAWRPPLGGETVRGSVVGGGGWEGERGFGGDVVLGGHGDPCLGANKTGWLMKRGRWC